jgi:4-hydroxyacetophenone monooxygenase
VNGCRSELVTNPVDGIKRWPATSDAVRRCSDEDLRRIVGSAKPHALRLCLYLVTRDERFRDIAVGHGESAGPIPVVTSPDDVEWLREQAVALLASYRDRRAEALLPTLDELRTLVEKLLGAEIPEWEKDYWWEEFAAVAHPRGCSWYGSLTTDEAKRFSVIVIGAGMGGITVAVNLERAGIPYTVVERNAGVGGTWYSNVYPGARVDITSRAYSYTWEPDWKWKHYYATQDELTAYFDHIVDKYDVRKNMRFCTEVTGAVWNEPEQVWDLAVRNTETHQVERMSANVLVSAVGIFSQRKLPDIPGMEDFQGRFMHTAQWDDAYELAGKRAATIGTGSSGVQIVGPLSERVERLYVFQRSGTWVQPTPHYVDPVPDDEQWLLDYFPYYLNWERLIAVFPLTDHRVRNITDLDIDPHWTEPGSISAWNKGVRDGLLKYLMEKIGDRPDLVEQCVPDYPPMTKRLPRDNGWFDALRKDHVTLVSDPIERFTAAGIRTTTGNEYAVDLVVLATGFQANQFLLPINFVGRDGLTLAERWSVDGARAYLGITIPGFPNLFCLYGPNTNGRAAGPCAWGELQARYAMEAIKYMIDNGVSSLDVRESVYDDFNKLLDERSKYMPWMDLRQSSYYRNEFGRSATNGPFLNRDYWPWTRRPNPDDFVAVR